MEFLDFIADLLWGASEVYFEKRDARKAEMRTQTVDKTRQTHEHTQGGKRAPLGEELANRGKTKDNKTV